MSVFELQQRLLHSAIEEELLESRMEIGHYAAAIHKLLPGAQLRADSMHHFLKHPVNDVQKLFMFT